MSKMPPRDSNDASDDPADAPLDPVFVNTRREAIIIMAVWALCGAWTVIYSRLNGYNLDPAKPIETVFGIPSWVFWGVAAPWTVALIFSIVYGLFFIADDDLGEHEIEVDPVERERAAAGEAEADDA